MVCEGDGSERSPMARKGYTMDRKAWDQLISMAGVVIAVVLVVVGGLVIYGGNFARDSVADRLEPQMITFPPTEGMSPEEQETLGEFAGMQVTDGATAEAYSDYIAGHLAEVNEGQTYAQTSSAARAEGISEDEAAELSAKADTLFKGETLRSILLNAYGWWTAGTIAMYAGFVMVVAGIIFAIFAFFGFRHARKLAAPAPTAPEMAGANA